MQTYVNCLQASSSRAFLHRQRSEHKIIKQTYVYKRCSCLSCLCRDECYSGVLLLTQLGPDYGLTTTDDGLSWTLCHSSGWVSTSHLCPLPGVLQGFSSGTRIQIVLDHFVKMLYERRYFNTGSSAVFVISGSHHFFINNFTFWVLLASAKTESICWYQH